jgi:uncharacterized membrane protein YciS (DUF1049 family)
LSINGNIICTSLCCPISSGNCKVGWILCSTEKIKIKIKIKPAVKQTEQQQQKKKKKTNIKNIT